MTLHRIGAALGVLLALACVSPEAWAEKLGPEFRINTRTAGDQDRASIARLSRGGFVVTWTSFQDGSQSSVHGQRYSAAGVPVGREFRVNTFRVKSQADPFVAGLSNGGFVVTWHSQCQDEYCEYGVYGQRYSATGAPAGGEFQVNTYTTDNQWFSSVTGLSDGGFVVTWMSQGQDAPYAYGVYGQRYSAAGARVGSEFRVNTYTGNEQWYPSVAGLSNGGFVVTWQSLNQDGPGYGVYSQRYSAAAARVGGEFRVNTHTSQSQEKPSVAGLSNGSFVVTWQSTLQDGAGLGVYGQRYGAKGAPAGGEFRVNTYTANGQGNPSVAGLSNGGFVVTWESFNQDGSGYGVYGRRYSAAGVRVGEFRVNMTTVENQYSPSVASLNSDGFVVTWTSNLQDGSGFGVYGQRFSGDTAPKVTLDPVGQTVRAGQTVTFTANASGTPSPCAMAAQHEWRGELYKFGRCDSKNPYLHGV